MRKALAALALAAAATMVGSRARAAVTFDYIFDGGYPIAVSSDGKTIVGSSTDGSYTSFRWTQATGLVSLGRPMQVGGAGVPGISADGTRIAYGIGSLDGTYSTQGLWTQATGWQELMPPPPADGASQDGSYGSVWGLSGNGQTVVGLYNRVGRAHASKWTQGTGVVDLGVMYADKASRANCVNFDGSVIAGWAETPRGPWRPAAWDNGTLVPLTYYNDSGLILIGAGEARSINATGDIITGFAIDSLNQQRQVAMWKKTNGVWGPTQFLGWVDGSEPQNGINIGGAVSYDGSIIVGYCSFDGTPFGTTGLVWTAATGVIDVNEYLANNGVLVDPNFSIQSMDAVTPDGRQLFGHGQMLTPPYTRRAFRITRPITAGVTPPVTVAHLALAAPSPNPSSALTRLDFELPTAGVAELAVFDASGRRVATLAEGEQSAGVHSASWDGRSAGGARAAAGLYFARLVTPQGSVSRRIVRAN